MDPNIKQSIVDRLKQTNNVLVTVKNNPTVDQLTACIGLTLFLNKQGKHATAVFSGEVPSILGFLKPDATLEKDTNSLRDFIIALDKSKADKLRYKVEDKVVKIFITPFKTSLSQDDLNFSLGDFNVDVVIALGVHGREELDRAIMAYGRILHDATIISINNNKPADLGALNWNDPKASSLSEMTTSLVDTLQPNFLDSQIATAFLTGIVAETDRFSNAKTSSITMNISAKLMSAGANQQLVATKLDETPKFTPPPPKPTDGNGTLEISHPKPENNFKNINHNSFENSIIKTKDDLGTFSGGQESIELPPPAASEESDDDGEIYIDDNGNFKTGLQDQKSSIKTISTESSRMTLEPPTLGGDLSANTHTNRLDPSIDPLSASPQNDVSILSHESPLESTHTPKSVTGKGIDIKPTQTLSSIEEQLDSPHLDEILSATSSNNDIKPPELKNSAPNFDTNNLSSYGKQDSQSGTKAQDEAQDPDSLEKVRHAVESATQSLNDQPLEPLQSLNSQPLGAELHSADESSQTTDSSQTAIPPPVPPPMMPPSFG